MCRIEIKKDSKLSMTMHRSGNPTDPKGRQLGVKVLSQNNGSIKAKSLEIHTK